MSKTVGVKADKVSGVSLAQGGAFPFPRVQAVIWDNSWSYGQDPTAFVSGGEPLSLPIPGPFYDVDNTIYAPGVPTSSGRQGASGIGGDSYPVWVNPETYSFNPGWLYSVTANGLDLTLSAGPVPISQLGSVPTHRFSSADNNFSSLGFSEGFAIFYEEFGGDSNWCFFTHATSSGITQGPVYTAVVLNPSFPFLSAIVPFYNSRYVLLAFSIADGVNAHQNLGQIALGHVNDDCTLSILDVHSYSQLGGGRGVEVQGSLGLTDTVAVLQSFDFNGNGGSSAFFHVVTRSGNTISIGAANTISPFGSSLFFGQTPYRIDGSHFIEAFDASMNPLQVSGTVISPNGSHWTTGILQDEFVTHAIGPTRLLNPFISGSPGSTPLGGNSNNTFRVIDTTAGGSALVDHQDNIPFPITGRDPTTGTLLGTDYGFDSNFFVSYKLDHPNEWLIAEDNFARLVDWRFSATGDNQWHIVSTNPFIPTTIVDNAAPYPWIAADSSGHGFDGKYSLGYDLHGAPSGVTGGGAFGGNVNENIGSIHQHYFFPSPIPGDFTNAFSVEYWITINDIFVERPGQGRQAWDVFMSDANNFGFMEIAFAPAQASPWHAIDQDNAGNQIALGDTLPDSIILDRVDANGNFHEHVSQGGFPIRWGLTHHLIVTWTRPSIDPTCAHFYVDGVEVGTDMFGHTYSDNTNTAFQRIAILNSGDAAPNLMSEFAVYDHVITPARAAAHYAARTSFAAYTAAVMADHPSVYYHLNEPFASAQGPAVGGAATAPKVGVKTKAMGVKS